MRQPSRLSATATQDPVKARTPLVSRVLGGLRLTVSSLSMAAIGFSIVVLIILVIYDEEAAEYTSGGEPHQFYRQLQGDLLDDYGIVLGVAHNSGNSIETTKKALARSADVIEVDVVSVRGRLYAAHRSPLLKLGPYLFRGPPFADIWELAAQAEAVKLDLKQSSPAFLELAFQFLEDRGGPQIIVSSPSPEVLEAFRERLPSAIRLLSVDKGSLKRLLEAGDLGAINGVTVHQRLLDQQTVQSLKARGLIVLAWPVNDLKRLNDLVRYEVDAITTDNLAIMELLGKERTGGATPALFTSIGESAAQAGHGEAGDHAKAGGEQ